MTAGEHLRFLSGLGSASAAAHLRAIAVVGVTAGAMLVAYSQLPSATAAQHLLVERAQAQQSLGAPSGSDEDFWAHSDNERERIRKQNDLIMLTVIAAVTGGMLR